MLEMITLGEYSTWMLGELENGISSYGYQEKIGDYFSANENRLMNDYPIIITIIKEMICSVDKRKNL